MSAPEEKTLAEERTEMAGERTRLAAERTFSSWLRTGLAGVGGGLAIIHFVILENPFYSMAARGMGQLLILWGTTLFVYALYGYHRIVKEFGKTFFPSKMWFMSSISIPLIIFGLIFLLFSFKF